MGKICPSPQNTFFIITCGEHNNSKTAHLETKNQKYFIGIAYAELVNEGSSEILIKKKMATIFPKKQFSMFHKFGILAQKSRNFDVKLKSLRPWALYKNTLMKYFSFFDFRWAVQELSWIAQKKTYFGAKIQFSFVVKIVSLKSKYTYPNTY